MVFATCIVSVKAQLLYRISGNSLKSPSYLVGTYHLAPPTFTDSIPGLRRVLSEVGQVYGEVVMSSATDKEAVAKMKEAMMLPEGVTLQTMLSADELSRVNNMMKDLLGADMTHPIVAEQMGKLKPQALLTQFTMLMYLKHNNNFDPNNALDTYLQNVAREQNKMVGGLESYEDQLEVLFGSIPLERQKKLLMCTVDNREYMEQLAGRLVDAYFTQDLKAIDAVFNEKLNNDCDATDEENEVLITGRNAKWIKLMPAVMGKRSTLFAVGAGHLVGERGLLQLLSAAGYTVEPVEK